MNWDKILNELSYIVKDGSPDLTNEQHLIKLWDILKEHNWSVEARVELLNNLSGTKTEEPKVLKEAATNRTEDLHEIFFAIAFAGGDISKAKDLKGLIDVINKTKLKLDNKQKTIDTLKKFDSKEKFPTKKDISLYKDATNLAKKTDRYLRSNKLKPKSVSRVFGTGPGGTKMIADAVINLTNGEIVSVSLKYGKGQFSSLSVPQLVEKVWGLKLNKGLLKDMYTSGYKSEIDTAFEYYQKATIEQKDLPIKDKYTQEDKDNLEKSGFSMKSTWMDFLKLSPKIRKAFTHLYNHSDNFGPRAVHKKMKGQLLNNAIDLFFQSKTKGVTKNLEEAIIYIIRAEPKTNYLYVADGGKKFSMIPSQENIRGKKYTFNDVVTTNDDGVISSADYTYDMEVMVDGIKAFTFDIKWRFAGQAGQWDGDLQHKGSKIIFHSGFAKAFGLPEIPKDMG
mgnify:CR=1 FL=1